MVGDFGGGVCGKLMNLKKDVSTKLRRKKGLIYLHAFDSGYLIVMFLFRCCR